LGENVNKETGREQYKQQLGEKPDRQHLGENSKHSCFERPGDTIAWRESYTMKVGGNNKHRNLGGIINT
jgi:hypothetical protein